MRTGYGRESVEYTEGVKLLLGEPRKAILKLSIPMVVAMLVQTTYNLVDAIWVSGLGTAALAAVGFVFPFYTMLNAISTGIGVGATTNISRRIGAGNRRGAGSVATHSLLMPLLLWTAFSLPLLLLSGPVFRTVGAGDVLDQTYAYGSVILAGSLFLMFSNIGNAVLRGEGDAKRAMTAMVIGAMLNIFLDPVFIYALDMGIAGAAWATILSLSVSSMLMIYWMIMKRSTYVEIGFRKFRLDGNVVKDIFRVGIPSSAIQLSMSFSMVLINFLLVALPSGGTDGVAVFGTGWKVVTIGTMPLSGIATAVIAISAAAIGQRLPEKLSAVHLEAIKIGMAMEIPIMIATAVFAPQIALAFTYSEGSARIYGDIVRFLRTIVIFYPFLSFGMISSAMFQGVGRGIYSLAVTVTRSIFLIWLYIFALAFALNMGLPGAWWGIVLANVTGSIIGFTWARIYIRRLQRHGNETKNLEK
ncbi:MAG: MATE family efflux transporter [Candidatus Hadarchaeales archaeon]